MCLPSKKVQWNGDVFESISDTTCKWAPKEVVAIVVLENLLKGDRVISPAVRAKKHCKQREKWRRHYFDLDNADVLLSSLDNIFSCQLTSPRGQLVLLQLLHLGLGALVVHLQDPDEVCDGQHADELLLLGVPEWRGADPIADEGEKGLLHQEVRVEHDQLGGRGDQVVAFVEAEELDKDLVLITLWKTKEKRKLRIENNKKTICINSNLEKCSPL